jgi:hypothetical protein
MLCRTAVASLLIVATACAADDFWLEEDLPFVDIRLGYGLVPKPDIYEINTAIHGGGQQTWTDSVDSNQAQALSFSVVGGTISPFGALFGAELIYASDSQDLTEHKLNGTPVPIPPDHSSMQYRTFGGNIMAGVGLALNRNVHLEGLGVLGVGALDLDNASTLANSQMDGGGWCWNAGVRGGLYFTWRKLVIGAVAEYSRMSYQAEVHWVDATDNMKDTITGMGGRIEIGYHIP